MQLRAHVILHVKRMTVRNNIILHNSLECRWRVRRGAPACRRGVYVSVWVWPPAPHPMVQSPHCWWQHLVGNPGPLPNWDRQSPQWHVDAAEYLQLHVVPTCSAMSPKCLHRASVVWPKGTCRLNQAESVLPRAAPRIGAPLRTVPATDRTT